MSRYRDRVCCFNDDIQGTAAVALAGLVSAGKITGLPLARQRVLFLGAGSAATGIASLIVSTLTRDGMPEEQARLSCWLLNRSGLVVQGGADLPDHLTPFAHAHPPMPDLLRAIEALRPTAIIGVSGQPGGFTEDVIRAMSGINPRPVIFALSNPTSQSECTAEEAYRWSDGRAVFAGGSPFEPVALNGRTLVPGQANNVYIFPGVGLGVIVSGARRVTDSMFHAAARTLAAAVSPVALDSGILYPRIGTIRTVSAAIARAVAMVAYEEGLATVPEPADLGATVAAAMYDAEYPVYA